MLNDIEIGGGRILGDMSFCRFVKVSGSTLICISKIEIDNKNIISDNYISMNLKMVLEHLITFQMVNSFPKEN